MTGSRLRHKHFSIELLKAFPNSLALIERDFEDSVKTYMKEPTEIVRSHFRAFEEMETRFFEKKVSENAELLRERLFLEIPDRGINDPETVEAVKTLDPRLIVVHSTGLIKEPFISSFPMRMINLHAGLSPYYRGSGTNVWPFYNEELEFVGMTVHYIDPGIDSGEILIQGRPVFEAGDDSHSIGCKNIQVGADLMKRVVRRYLDEGPLPAHKQDKSRGKLYLKKKFDDDAVLKIRAFIDAGGVGRYAASPKHVDIVDWD